MGQLGEGHSKDTSGFSEYKLLIMTELNNHGKALNEIHKDLISIQKDIVALQTKATLWGSIGGFASGIIASIITAFILWKAFYYNYG